MALVGDLQKRIAQLEAREKSRGLLPASSGKPGRKTTTADIAAFANGQRPRMTWKEICAAWKRQHPGDQRNGELTAEKVRGAWRRKLRKEHGSRPRGWGEEKSG